jgi:DNA-binding transcriptional LysR family regulator
MSVSLRQIRSFVAIAQLGSFTKAAKALNLSQPSLTVQIRQLEAALGVRVLDRNTHSAAPTTLGRALLPSFQRVLRELDTMLADARDVAAKRRGIVRLACLPSFAATLLPGVIADFRALYPGVGFVVKDAVGRRVAAMVKSDTVDFGVTAGETKDPELERLALMEDRLHAVFPRDHALGRARRITPRLLAQHPLILMDEESTVRALVDAGFAAHGLVASPAFEATYMTTAVGMVQAGLGVALLPSSAIEARPNERVASRPIDARAFIRRIWVVRLSGRSLPPAAEVFLEQLAAAARGAAASLPPAQRRLS